MSLLPEIKKPEIVEKEWGREVIIENNEKYCGKILEFEAGTKLSNHFHLKKTETWYILEGELKFYYYDYEAGEQQYEFLTEGHVVHIPVGVLHRLEVIESCRIFEVSTQHFDEDSYRIQPSERATGWTISS